jgi:uncharacterized protein YjiK
MQALCILLAATVAAVFAGGWTGQFPVRAGDGGVLSRYNLAGDAADRWELPRALDEISGLAMDSAGNLFAHGDERAEIFQLDPGGHRVVARFSFGEPAVHGDFEGIAVAGDRIFLVTSDGVLYAGRRGADGQQVDFVTYSTGLGSLCEIEGLAYDASNPSLLLACKEARSGQLRHRLAIYRWSIDRRALFPKPALLMGLAPVVKPIREKGFHPSDITIDPGTGHLLVLASREHAIAELTPAGEVVQVSLLRRRLHPQAEGIAIDSNGWLILADEGTARRGSLTMYAPTR